jgi:hypothetical protein
MPPGTCVFLCCECCVSSGRGLCDELITRLEESYRLWRVVVCDLETSWMRRPCPTGGCRAKNKRKQRHFNGLYLIIFFMCFKTWGWLFTKAETCSQQQNWYKLSCGRRLVFPLVLLMYQNGMSLINIFTPPTAQQPPVGQGFPII